LILILILILIVIVIGNQEGAEYQPGYDGLPEGGKGLPTSKGA
jgi:hypothetical protein